MGKEAEQGGSAAEGGERLSWLEGKGKAPAAAAAPPPCCLWRRCCTRTAEGEPGIPRTADPGAHHARSDRLDALPLLEHAHPGAPAAQQVAVEHAAAEFGKGGALVEELQPPGPPLGQPAVHRAPGEACHLLLVVHRVEPRIPRAHQRAAHGTLRDLAHAAALGGVIDERIECAHDRPIQAAPHQRPQPHLVLIDFDPLVPCAVEAATEGPLRELEEPLRCQGAHEQRGGKKESAYGVGRRSAAGSTGGRAGYNARVACVCVR